MMSRLFPSLMKRLGSKQKDIFFRQISVQIVNCNAILAEENKTPDAENLIVVVSGNLKVYKRS